VTKKVFWAILAKQAENTLPLYLKCLLNQDYDKKSIVLYIRTNDNTDQTESILEKFISEHGDKFSSVIYDNSSVDTRLQEFQNHDWNAFRFQILGKIRNHSLKLAEENECDFYFVCDVDNFIVSNTLSNLVSLNLEIVAPMLVNAKSKEARDAGIGGGDLYSNFHCDYDEEGAYLHDSRYDRLITREDRGIHRVRLIHCTYLVRVDVIPKIDYLLNPYNYEYRNFTISAEQNGVPQYLDNRIPYGSLSLIDDPSESESLIQDFERLSRPNSIVYKILHVGNDENRKANHRNLDRLFGKYFHRLSAKTQYLSSLEDTRSYLASNSDLKVLDNLDYEGWLPGAIGIWASWKNALNVFTKSDSAALILMEDDLWVTEEFVSRDILMAASELPAGWDYLTLYTPEPQRNVFTDEYDEGLQFACRPYHTHCNVAVIFSQSGAEKLLKHMSEGVFQNTDLYLFINKDNSLKGFALKPEVMLHKISTYLHWNSTVGVPHQGRIYSKSDLYESNE
jgi:GR25 family glycosyltransferase involved in LPS biosynthesis